MWLVVVVLWTAGYRVGAVFPAPRSLAGLIGLGAGALLVTSIMLVPIYVVAGTEEVVRRGLVGFAALGANGAWDVWRASRRVSQTP